MNNPILRTDTNNITTLTLNRPGARNVLSVEMMTAMQAELETLAQSRETHVVIIRAIGPGFCAGHDLKEMQDRRTDKDKGEAFFRALFAQCTKLMTTLRNLPQPVIAEVQGIAVAAGCQLVGTCDLAYAGASARFGVNGIDVGFFCSTPMVALSRNVARKKAMDLLTTGRLMSAAEARESGLVNEVMDDDRLAEATLALAETIARKPPRVIALGKKAFNAQIQMDVSDAYALTQEVMIENLLMEESTEGFTAFIEKRLPEWPKQ